MKRVLSILFLLVYCHCLLADTPSVPNDSLYSVWNTFRKEYPLCFQSVGLKHIGNDCVFVISEPSDNVSQESLNKLVNKYNGTHLTMKQPIGHDGWLKDYVAAICFSDNSSFEEFGDELFTLLYNTPYKKYYTDLDNPVGTTYFSPYKLNYSIPASSLKQWFINDKEEFIEYNDDKCLTTISDIISSDKASSNKLYYSKNQGFVAWFLTPDQLHKCTKSFMINARRFALDCDLIIGAFGTTGKSFVIVGRERAVPISVLPPLRAETIQMLADSRDEELSQSYERHNVFGGKTRDGIDVAPIYLSDQLWHSEYGNLLNITDQMLKSWSENGTIEYATFSHPKPVNWAFDDGASLDLRVSQLTYNWNTAGAGYVISGDSKFDILAVNRTGSLPVSYIPEGTEGMAPDNVVEFEELAYDFFSQLENPYLCRVVQYATLYQIFRYFDVPDFSKEYSYYFNLLKHADANSNLLTFIRDCKKLKSARANDYTENGDDVYPMRPSVPISYENLEKYVERLLIFASNRNTEEYKDAYKSGLERFSSIFRENSAALHFQQLVKEDPHGEFLEYMKSYNEDYIGSLMSVRISESDIKENYDYFINQSVDSVCAFINNYKQKYGEFPYRQAAHILTCPHNAIKELRKKEDVYNFDKFALVSLAQDQEEERLLLQKEMKKNNDKANPTLESKIDVFVKLQKVLDKYWSEYENKQKVLMRSLEKEYALLGISSLEQHVGSLNYLLTNTDNYKDPFGDFFSDKLSGEGVWMRCPTIVASTYKTGYGGHNLSSRVTPVQISKSVPKGQFKVSTVGGKKIVAIAPEDISRMTTSQLRTIERTAITGSHKYAVSTAKAVVPKSKIIAPRTSVAKTTSVRGFDTKIEAQATASTVEKASAQKQLFINGTKVDDARGFVRSASEQIAKGNEAGIKEIRFENYSANEVVAYKNDIMEGIVERTSELDIDLTKFDVNEISIKQMPDASYVIQIPQKAETLPRGCKAGFVEIQTSGEKANSVKSALIKVLQKAKNKINNNVKWHHQLKKELEKLPDVQIDDLKDDYRLIFSYIFELYQDEDIYDEFVLIS